MSTQPPIRVAVVGGGKQRLNFQRTTMPTNCLLGVAGLSTALALQKFRKEGANLTFTIYEQAV
jgi:hypothetical protein